MQVEIVKNLIEKTINDNNYSIYKIEYVKEGSSNFLRVIIDKQGGAITIEDCVVVSNLINPILDENDPIKEAYILDVCSKGGNEDEQ